MSRRYEMKLTAKKMYRITEIKVMDQVLRSRRIYALYLAHIQHILVQHIQPLSFDIMPRFVLSNT